MKSILFFSVIFACLVSHEKSLASSVTIAWDASSSPNVAGYYVYYGNTNGQVLTQVDAGNANSETISNLPAGATVYFAITAYDAFGDESPYSNQINFIVPGILTIGPGSASASSHTIQFPVAPGHWYDLQTAGDLKSWQSVWQTAVAVSNIWMNFVDTNTASSSSRFYRVVSH